MNEIDWNGVIVTALIVLVVGVAVIVAIKQVFETARAAMNNEVDKRHAELAQRYETLVAESTAAQHQLATDVAEIKTSLAAMERMMAEV